MIEKLSSHFVLQTMDFRNLILKFNRWRIKNGIRRGKIHLIDNINLKDDWVYHPLMRKIRETVIPLVENKLKSSDLPFDPQDLEHQILFKLTTFSPRQLFGQELANYLRSQIRFWQDIEYLKIEKLEINPEILNQILEEQYLIIRDRLRRIENIVPLNRIFRGLTSRCRDLNRFNRLILERQNGNLVATATDGYREEVEFRKIEYRGLADILIDNFHYIHNERSRGDIFAFFFKGDDFPWGVETTEKSCYSRPYKRTALLANGIHPDRAVELTRYYTLPGCPRNSISVIDSLVRDYYGPTEIEALTTCTMPNYAKTKSSTIAGGINQLLFVKPLKHQFIKIKVGEKFLWQHATKRLISQLRYRGEIIYSHPEFPLYPTFEVYVIIKKEPTFNKLPELQNKVISFL